jgi:hypothetical protein
MSPIPPHLSTSTDDIVNAVMEVYAANQTLLRTSSLPEPIVLNDSDGTIQLATTFLPYCKLMAWRKLKQFGLSSCILSNFSIYANCTIAVSGI